jgi:hypothetical protein
VPSGDPRTPSQILGELLTGHPEAASLLAEASHRRALARSSAANAGQAFAAAQAARLGYTELRHQLDPRSRRTIGFGAGLVVLVLLGAGLTLLDGIELGGMWSLPADLAATAMWLTGAWLAAVASRERRWPLVIAGAGTRSPQPRCSVCCSCPCTAWGPVRAGRRLAKACCSESSWA